MQVIYSICMVYRKKEKRECKRQKDEKAKDAKQLPCNDLSNMAYVYKEIVEWGAELNCLLLLTFPLPCQPLMLPFSFFIDYSLKNNSLQVICDVIAGAWGKKF